MYNHLWAWPSKSFEPLHHSLPPNAIPLDTTPSEQTQDNTHNTYCVLQQYFALEIHQHINLEANHLCKSKYLRTVDPKTSKFNWDTILNFLISTIQQTTMQLAPVIWTVVTLIAVDNDRAAGLKQARSSEKREGKGSNHICNPYLVGLSVDQSYSDCALSAYSTLLGCLHHNHDAPLLSQFKFEQVPVHNGNLNVL